MQIHLNGFHAGDPDIHLPAKDADDPDRVPLSEVDVLVVGSGPAGLTLAAYLSNFPDIKTRIVERRLFPMEKGQADGVSCRSMEMFQVFGFAEKVKREAYWVNETTFWNPDPDNPQVITRTGRIPDTPEGLSEMPHVILNQARIHDRYLEIMRNSPTRLEPDYGRSFAGLEIAENGPVTVTLDRSDADFEGTTETIKARYVVGCDGARSGVRGAIGREMRGDRANQAWGVMDILAVSDFPDYRLKSLIKSNGYGNIVLIPREGNHLVRVYVEMDAIAEGKRLDPKTVKIDDLIAAANRIFSPYKIDVKDVPWWSIYEIGHAVTDKFDDVPAGKEDSQSPCVFIAGDACHTHSAKAGQGMNVSMGDAFNLGWKLVTVLQGKSDPSLLHSYSAERQKVAQDLIDFDHEWSRIISAPPEEDASEGETPKFQSYFIEHGRYTAGLSVKYAPSNITGDGACQHLAKGFEIGTRFHSAPVIRLGDAKPMQLGHVIEADARWRLLAFADAPHPTSQSSAFVGLCNFLETSENSPLTKFQNRDAQDDGQIDFRAIFQQSHLDLDFAKMPAVLRPARGQFGLQDYEKMFCPDPNQQDIFDIRGIDRKQGCIVILRPDQHVSQILTLTDFRKLTDFFEAF